MQVKLAAVLLFFALFAQPMTGVANLNFPHSMASYEIAGLSDQERILLLESFEAQQNGHNTQLDDRFTKNIEAIAQAQTEQDHKIAQLESRLDVVYRFGALIAFILTLSVPVFLWILNKSQAHNAKIASSISNLAADVQVIKTVCNIRNRHMQAHPDQEEEDLLSCLP